MKLTSSGALCALLVLFLSPAARGIDLSVPAVGGDLSRSLLGDGTGVVVGVIDSGVDETHPALAGLDSLGQPRLVAEANFVGTEPGNTGDDVHGHGTQVASVIGGADPLYTGFAPDARLINARVLNSSNGFPNDIQVRNGVGFAIDQGSDVLNLSLNYFSVFSGGNGQLDLMLDWAAFERGIPSVICAGNIGQAQDNDPRVRGPAGSYNGLSVGYTDFDFDQVNAGSANAYTQNGRMKPDLVAPGTSITMANDDWETQGDYNSASGCSFATPHVAGLLAQQIDAGRTEGISTNPLVLKATMMNAASKAVLDKQGNPWTATSANPLDTHSGAGQIDAVALAEQYLAGEQEAGLVDPIGWDLGSVADNAFVDYAIDAPLAQGSELTATLTWFRHVSRTDDGDGQIDAGDSFLVTEPLDNLDLVLLENGSAVSRSISNIDNVEHLWTTVNAGSSYTLRVFGNNITGPGIDEPFALAWSSVSVPEPAGVVLLGMAVLGIGARRSVGRFRVGASLS